MRPAQVAEVAREIAARRGDRVRAVNQDGPLRFRLALEGEAGRVDLVLDLDPSFPRVHLDDARPAPAAPTAFASALRARLVGSRLVDARAVPGERALRIAFRRGEDEDALWFEGFGRGANFYVLDGGGRVALTPRGNVALERGAAVGVPFEEVPARPDVAGPTEAGGSVAVAEAARAHTTEQAARALRTVVLRALKRRLARAERVVAALEAMASRGPAAAGYQRLGELLQASFHLLEPGRDRVTVPDHTRDGEEVEIELDPRVAPGEQIGRLFHRAKRARRAGEEAAARMPEARAARDAAREALAVADATEDPAVLADLAETLRLHPGAAKPKAKGPPRARPWREYRSKEGWPILVGKDAKGNDALTLHRARPGDLFLHVRGGGGSHVIVPTPRGKTVPRDTLLEAAELAVWFSTRRGAPAVEVDYVPRRYVRKPRKAPPGLVMVERAKTLGLRTNEARRRRVLSTRQEPHGGEHPRK